MTSAVVTLLPAGLASSGCALVTATVASVTTVATIAAKTTANVTTNGKVTIAAFTACGDVVGPLR